MIRLIKEANNVHSEAAHGHLSSAETAEKQGSSSEQKPIDDDFDFNFEVAVDTKKPKALEATSAVAPELLPRTECEKLSDTAKLLRMLHRVLESYMLLIPNEVQQDKFDLLRLLDDHVKWTPQQPLKEAMEHWQLTADKTLTLSILHILKLSAKNHCRWCHYIIILFVIITSIFIFPY